MYTLINKFEGKKYMYDPIAVFDYNNKKYGILSIEGTTIFFKYQNGKVNLDDLSDDEINLVYKAFNALKVDVNRSINLGVQAIGNKNFEILYDPFTKLYSWYHVISGVRYYASEEDNCKLNCMYNDMCFVAYEGEIFDWKEEELRQEAKRKAQIRKKIRRTMRVGGRTVLITVAAASLFLNISNSSLANNIRGRLHLVPTIQDPITKLEISEINEAFENYEKRPYSYDEVKSAIYNNENLTDEEKEFIDKLKFYFDENHKYMNMDNVIGRLKNLKIEYDPNECEKPSVTGEYNYHTDEIKLFKANDFSSCNKSVFLHEMMHVTQQYNTNQLSLELSNELATREALRRMHEKGLLEGTEFKNYLGKDSMYGTGYNPCMNTEYLLANILDSEDLKKFQFMTDEDILVEALIKIDSEGSVYDYMSHEDQIMRYRAINVVEAINQLARRDENGYLDIQYTNDRFDDVYDQLNHYYEKKYGIPMQESLSANIVNYDVAFSNWDPYTREYVATMLTMKDEAVKQTHNEMAGFGEYKYVLPKTFYTDEHENPTIIFNAEQDIVEVEITPDVEKKYQENYEKQKGMASTTKSIDEYEH